MLGNKIISYSFFEPYIMPAFRFWDNDLNSKIRYYYNIPTILLLNKILYPDYITKIYLTLNVYDNPLSRIFKIFEGDDVILENVDIKYKLTEPAIFRMSPLWDDCDVLHVRDIDSVPTLQEYRFVRAFESYNFMFGTMRTHPNHCGKTCSILAGLCSFLPNRIPTEIKGDSFQDYYNSRPNKYGSDQDLLMKYFVPHFNSSTFYDCPTSYQNNPSPFECTVCDSEQLSSIFPTDRGCDLLSFIADKNENLWAGKPIDTRGETSDYILGFFPAIKEKIMKDSRLSNFYRIA